MFICLNKKKFLLAQPIDLKLPIKIIKLLTFLLFFAKPKFYLDELHPCLDRLLRYYPMLYCRHSKLGLQRVSFHLGSGSSQ
jgi:hypothetical protein